MFCSGQVPLDPETGELVEGVDRRRRRAAAWRTSRVVAAAAGAQLADAVRMGIYVTDMGDVQGGQRGLRRRTSRPTRRPARRSASPRCPLGAEGRDRCRHRAPRLSRHRRRRRGGAARRRGDRAAHADAVLAHDLRARGRRRRAEGREPPAHRLVQGPRRRRPSSPRWARRAARNGVVAASAGNHAQGARRRRRARAACTARCSCPPTRRSPRSRRRAARARRSTSAATRVDECLAAARARAERGRAGVRAPVRRSRRRRRPGLARARAARGRARPRQGRRAGRRRRAVRRAWRSRSSPRGPRCEVVGVQVAACAPYPESLRRGEPVPATSALTIADGIAVKRPGELTLPLLDALGRRRRRGRRGRDRRGDGAC